MVTLPTRLSLPQKPEDRLLQSASRGPAGPQRLLCGAPA